MQISQLQAELDTLQEAAAEIRKAGYIPYPSSFCLDSFSKSGKTYYRKRVRLPDGKPGKPEYISPQLHAELWAELERGRKLHRLKKKIHRVCARLERALMVARSLGLYPHNDALL